MILMIGRQKTGMVPDLPTTAHRIFQPLGPTLLDTTVVGFQYHVTACKEAT